MKKPAVKGARAHSSVAKVKRKSGNYSTNSAADRVAVDLLKNKLKRLVGADVRKILFIDSDPFARTLVALSQSGKSQEHVKRAKAILDFLHKAFFNIACFQVDRNNPLNNPPLPFAHDARRSTVKSVREDRGNAERKYAQVLREIDDLLILIGPHVMFLGSLVTDLIDGRARIVKAGPEIFLKERWAGYLDMSLAPAARGGGKGTRDANEGYWLSWHIAQLRKLLPDSVKGDAALIADLLKLSRFDTDTKRVNDLLLKQHLR
jgi:hypothetical protein